MRFDLLFSLDQKNSPASQGRPGNRGFLRRRPQLPTRWLRALAICPALLTIYPADALHQETQTWFTTGLRAPIGEEQSYLSLRYRGRYTGAFERHRLDQYQLTLGTRFGKGPTVAAGFEYFRTDGGTIERRWFPETHWHSRILGLGLRQRLRLEMRDLALFDDPIYRLRYQVTHEAPLGDRGAYVVLANEFFVSLSEERGILDRGFSQNRIGGGLGLRLGSGVRAELGYQWGYVDSGLIERGDHLLQLNLFWVGR